MSLVIHGAFHLVLVYLDTGDLISLPSRLLFSGGLHIHFGLSRCDPFSWCDIWCMPIAVILTGHLFSVSGIWEHSLVPHKKTLQPKHVSMRKRGWISLFKTVEFFNVQPPATAVFIFSSTKDIIIVCLLLKTGSLLRGLGFLPYR